jgi:hypothetical protein
METGARSPEELETLFEDAFVTRDAGALSAMFADGGVLALDSKTETAHGATEIARLASGLWTAQRIYVAEPRRVVQARRTALVVGDDGINVVRRGRDGQWRYAIALLSFGRNPTKET